MCNTCVSVIIYSNTIQLFHVYMRNIWNWIHCNCLYLLYDLWCLKFSHWELKLDFYITWLDAMTTSTGQYMFDIFDALHPLSWWCWRAALGFSQTRGVCHALLLRKPSSSPDWGQRQLNGTFSISFFSHLHSSHSFVGLWHWASSHCAAGSRRYIRFSSDRLFREKPDATLASLQGQRCERRFLQWRADEDFLHSSRSWSKSPKKMEWKSESMGHMWTFLYLDRTSATSTAVHWAPWFNDPKTLQNVFTCCNSRWFYMSNKI